MEVTLKDGSDFGGILFDADKECFILRSAIARHVGSKSEDVPVDGEVLILRADVAFIQVL